MIGEFSHESNCFCQKPTTLTDFEQTGELLWDDAVVIAHQGKHTVLGGFLDIAVQEGHQIVTSVAASTTPSGPVTAQFYHKVKESLVDAARKTRPLDGVFLSLHGALSVEDNANAPDPEGDIVASVRAVIGPDVPIVVVLDLHSDTTDLLIKNASITLAFNEEPHRDMFERGAEAAKLIQKIRRGEVHPTASRERPPMLLPAINMATEKGPMHELHKLRAELEATPGVIDISIHGGFYGTDSSEAGFSVVCTTDSNVNLARRQARTVAIEAWRRREEFIVPVVPIKIALKEALSAGEPVGLIDECDDPAGGGSGDSVVILRGMLDAGAKSGGISTVMDYGVARKMAEAGEGTKVTVTLGAKTDSLHGKSVDVSGRVIKLFNGPVPSDTWSGKTQNAGIVGVLDIGGILVVVTEHKIVTENIDIFNLLGFDVTKLQAIGFKGLGLHVRQALAGKIGRFIPIDGAGVTHPDVRKLGPYKRIRRPTWPLDDIPADAYPDADMS